VSYLGPGGGGKKSEGIIRIRVPDHVEKKKTGERKWSAESEKKE